MKKLTLLLYILAACAAHATQPPRPGELERYRKDGTLAKRMEAYKARGNHRVRPDVAARTLQRLQNMTSDRKINAPLPSWEGMPTTGTNKVLILLVEFPDYLATVSKTTLERKIFGHGEAGAYPLESLTEYYRRSSYGQLHITGNVLGWYRMSRSRSWYTSRYGDGNETNYQIMREIVEAYDDTHDYSQYDNNDDGVIDYVAVVWTGPDTGWSGFWWGYQWSLDTNLVTDDGVRFDSFTWQWESNPIGTGFDPSVIIHETGHALGLPDYYDYAPGIGPDGGVGDLDMMDGTKGDHNAFSKFMLEWLTPTFVSSGERYISLRAQARHPDALIAMQNYTNATAYGEYFLIENRHRVMNDTGMPADGMLFWHVDATPNDAGTDFEYDNSDTSHKLLRLMEADGLEQIEAGESGEIGDYYNQGDAFTPSTTPNSLRYDGSQSQVYVTNLSTNDARMYVNVSIDQVPVSPTIAHTPGVLQTFIPMEQLDSSQPLDVWVNTSSNVAYTITDNADWLTFFPTNGTSDGTHNAHTINYSTSSLTTGVYTATISITSPAAANSPVNIPVIVQIYGTNLAKAVDATTSPWRTGGNVPWLPQTISTHDGFDAAQSGGIQDEEMSWIETDVFGPGTLTFWWRTSCEFYWDRLRMSVNAHKRDRLLSGETFSWQQGVLQIPSIGLHTIRWEYTKDFSVSAASDTVWLDEVSWTPNTSDTDNDGLYDWQETVTGTSSTNSDSSLHIDSVLSGTLDNTMILQWPSFSNRVYSVNMASNLLNTTFDELTTHLPATPPQNIYTAITEVVTGAYYRVSVTRLPVSDLVLIDEDFESQVLPSGWSTVANGDSGASWTFNNPGGRPNDTGGSNNFAIADSDTAGETVRMDTDLLVPVLNCSNMETLFLEFKSSFEVFSHSLAGVMVRTNGAPWNLIWLRTNNDWGPLTYTLDLTPFAAGQSSVEIAFHYVGEWEWYWKIDDVKVYGQPIH